MLRAYAAALKEGQANRGGVSELSPDARSLQSSWNSVSAALASIRHEPNVIAAIAKQLREIHGKLEKNPPPRSTLDGMTYTSEIEILLTVAANPVEFGRLLTQRHGEFSGIIGKAVSRIEESALETSVLPPVDRQARLEAALEICNSLEQLFDIPAQKKGPNSKIRCSDEPRARELAGELKTQVELIQQWARSSRGLGVAKFHTIAADIGTRNVRVLEKIGRVKVHFQKLINELTGVESCSSSEK